ncbi:MAG: nicotinate-nucleotide adenylyltransferase [Oceanospirillaceae bacterium]|nr:nicotinate-nucleotide adenylyltransferase [Oceanospirillaceae bacterium]
MSVALSTAKDSVSAYVFMGGTFDPVHKGHIRGARHVSALFDVTPIHLLPAKVPVHKSAPSTTNVQRINMLKIALAQEPDLKLDLREINSTGASYTIETLKQLRTEIGATRPLIMVIGMDSFVTLPSWSEFEQFLSLCHIVVLQRPQYCLEYSERHKKLLMERVDNASALLKSTAGHLYFFEQPTTDVSASDIRRDIKNRKHSDLLPQGVADYIGQQCLYQ